MVLHDFQAQGSLPDAPTYGTRQLAPSATCMNRVGRMQQAQLPSRRLHSTRYRCVVMVINMQWLLMSMMFLKVLLLLAMLLLTLRT